MRRALQSLKDKRMSEIKAEASRPRGLTKGLIALPNINQTAERLRGKKPKLARQNSISTTIFTSSISSPHKARLSGRCLTRTPCGLISRRVFIKPTSPFKSETRYDAARANVRTSFDSILSDHQIANSKNSVISARHINLLYYAFVGIPIVPQSEHGSQHRIVSPHTLLRASPTAVMAEDIKHALFMNPWSLLLGQ